MHLITTSLCNANGIEGGLSVAFLAGAQTGNIAGGPPVGTPTVFLQNTSGDWSPSYQLTAPVQMSSIVGLPNLLVGLGADRNLYLSIFKTPEFALAAPSNWGAFQPIAAPTQGIRNPPSGFDDFCAAVVNVNNAGFLVIVGVQNIAGKNALGQATDGGFFAWTISMHDLVVGAGVMGGSWSSISQTSTGLTGGVFSPALVPLNPNGAVLVGIESGADEWNGNGFLVEYFTADLATYTAADSFVLEFGMPSPAPNIAAIAGNPNGTLQVVIPCLASGLQLVFDRAGQANIGLSTWASYGDLFPASLPQSFVAVAAALGNVSGPNTTNQNLQVVGLNQIVKNPGVITPGNGAYLAWQDQYGNWAFPTAGETGSGPSVSGMETGFNDSAGPYPPDLQPLDLAMGMGYGPGEEPFLQVLYFASDGNVYLNYQDNFGNWFWYPGLQESGLP